MVGMVMMRRMIATKMDLMRTDVLLEKYPEDLVGLDLKETLMMAMMATTMATMRKIETEMRVHRDLAIIRLSGALQRRTSEIRSQNIAVVRCPKPPSSKAKMTPWFSSGGYVQ